jgi:hypothetical protein
MRRLSSLLNEARIESTISATEFALHSVGIVGACFGSWIDIVGKISDEQTLNPIITYDQE